MSRGKQEKTKIREAVREGVLVAESIRLANVKAEQKIHESKSLMDSLREHIGKMIDRVDPLEVAAIMGTTYLIKNGIEWSEEVVKNAPTFLKVVAPTFVFGWLVPEPTAEQKEKIGQLMDTPEAEVIQWLLSFTVAFYLVRHGDEITGSLIGSAKSLLGIATVA